MQAIRFQSFAVAISGSRKISWGAHQFSYYTHTHIYNFFNRFFFNFFPVLYLFMILSKSSILFYHYFSWGLGPTSPGAPTPWIH